MAVITPTPMRFDDYVLKIPTDDYAAACTSCTLTPKASVERLNGGKPSAIFKDVEIDWTLDIEHVQDWASSTSLSRKLWAAQGTVITGVEFEPQTGAGPKFTVDLLIVPGSVGGTSRKTATSRVSIEVVGQPTFDGGEE